MYPSIQIGESFIPSFGLMVVLGVFVASWVAFRRLIRAHVPPNHSLIMLLCVLLGAFAGASLFYLFVTFSWAEIMAIIRSRGLRALPMGGVFYGGLVGGFLGALLGQRLSGERMVRFISPVVPVIPLAHAFGRVGCFLAGCCYGIPVPHPFGIAYSRPFSDAPPGIPLLPIQLIEAILNLALSVVLFRLADRKHRNPWLVFFFYITAYAVMRFALEFFRYDEIRGSFLRISTSQWISLLLLVVCALGYAWTRRIMRTGQSGEPDAPA